MGIPAVVMAGEDFLEACDGRLAALVVLTALCNTVLCNVVQLDSGWSLILSTLGCAALGSFFVTPNAAGEENSHAEP